MFALASLFALVGKCDQSLGCFQLGCFSVREPLSCLFRTKTACIPNSSPPGRASRPATALFVATGRRCTGQGGTPPREGTPCSLYPPVTLQRYKEVTPMFLRQSILSACGAAILGLVMTASGKAWVTPNRTTLLTFSGQVALPGVVLTAGTYTFERADGHPDIVRVLSRDRSRVYFMAFTRQV